VPGTWLRDTRSLAGDDGNRRRSSLDVLPDGDRVLEGSIGSDLLQSAGQWAAGACPMCRHSSIEMTHLLFCSPVPLTFANL
jgi:hypothetical protein